MMKKMSTIIYAILVFLMILTPTVFAEEVLSYTDDINDVLDATTGKKISRPNIDIYKISCSKVGKVVELKLQLTSGGKIQNKMTLYYTMDLTTNLNTYMALYGGGEIGVTDENESEIDVIEYSGDGTNELKISFNLSSSDEVCLNLSAQTAEFSMETEEAYIDQYPEEFEFIEVNAGGPYTGTEGKPIQFYGNADYEGSNLEWSWDFGDGGTSEVKNPKHTYNESGTFEVFLEVSDSTGIKFGIDNTTVTISPSSTPNGDGGSKDSGLGIIVFVVLIIVVVIVGVVAVFFIRRR